MCEIKPRRTMRSLPIRRQFTVLCVTLCASVLMNDILLFVEAFSVVPSLTITRHGTAKWSSQSELSEHCSVEINNVEVSSSTPPKQQGNNTNEGDDFSCKGRDFGWKITTATDKKVLRHYQKEASNIVTSFVPTSSHYDPVPILNNRHVQTIGGVVLRKSLPELKYVKKDDWISSVIQVLGNTMQRKKSNDALGDNDRTVPKFWDERERIETPDSDWFHADYKYAVDTKQNAKEKLSSSSSSSQRGSSPSANGLLILLHGLGSSSESGLSKELANGYHQLGLDVVCLNFRGCSGTPNDTLGGYHIGFTDDLKHYLSLVKSRCGGKKMPPIYLSGYSLGSNIVLKALGELGESATKEYNIQGAALQCVPLDHVQNRFSLEAPGFFPQVYASNLLKPLKAQLRHQLDVFCGSDENTDRIDYPRAMAATKLSQYDDACTAPVYGFDSYLDYYSKTSSIYFLDGIAVPTLIANAKDDPFFDPNVWPVDKSCEGGGHAPIKLIHSEKGGHLGFLFHQIEDEDELLHLQSDPLSPSWCSAECARFIDHVHSAA